MTAWLFQANPRRSDALARLRAGAPVDRWCVRRHLSELTAGDDVAVWLSGTAAGVYACGRLCGGAERDGSGGWQVPLTLDDRFPDEPVLRRDLRLDPRFAGAAVLAQPFAANPFPLTPGEWAAVLDLRRRPRPRRG